MWHHARMIAAAAASGMSLWQEALLFGLISSLSLPIGAMLGQRLSPVSDHVVAAIVAFGAGALLFAVTVELYGHALHEVALGTLGYTEMFTTVVCALLGAFVYLWLNERMEKWVEGDGEAEEEPEPRSASSNAPKAKAKASASTLARWDSVRRHARELGAEAVAGRVRSITASQALNLFCTGTTREHEKLLEGVRGRKKRMLLAVGATHASQSVPLSYGAVEDGASADEDEEEKKLRIEQGMRLAHAMFLGLVVDGVPESILLGFLAAEQSLSMVLVLSLFVANFPEAFSAASLMKEADVPVSKIVGMWSALCALTGVLAALACAALLWIAGDAAATGEMPFHIAMTIAVVEGIAGGAMIACIASVMLPEAFGRKHKTNLLMDSGFLCTAGFLCAVVIKVVGGVVTSHHMKKSGEKAPDEHTQLVAIATGTPQSFNSWQDLVSNFFVPAAAHFFSHSL